MRHTKKTFVIIATLVSACAFTQEAEVQEEMYTRASALTKLSASMEALIRYGNPLTRATEAELLAEGTAHDPALLANLGDFRIRVLSDDRHAVVLLCSKDGTRALLEDAGCTGALDVRHWDKPPVPCEFTLTAARACGRK